MRTKDDLWREKEEAVAHQLDRLRAVEAEIRERVVRAAVRYALARALGGEPLPPLYVPAYDPAADDRRGNDKARHDVYNVVRLPGGRVVPVAPVYRTGPVECVGGHLARSNTTFARSVVTTAATKQLGLACRPTLRFEDGRWVAAVWKGDPLHPDWGTRYFAARDTPDGLAFDLVRRED